MVTRDRWVGGWFMPGQRPHPHLLPAEQKLEPVHVDDRTIYKTTSKAKRKYREIGERFSFHSRLKVSVSTLSANIQKSAA